MLERHFSTEFLIRTANGPKHMILLSPLYLQREKLVAKITYSLINKTFQDAPKSSKIVLKNIFSSARRFCARII